MQHGREGALPAFLLQNAGHIRIGLAGVDHQRQAGLASGRDVLAEALLLRVARRGVVVVIEPGLADRHDFRVPGNRCQRLGIDVEFFVRVVRMGADRAENVGEFLRDRQHLRVFLHARRDRD